MQRLIKLENRLKVRLITVEFELLAWLYLHGATRSQELARRTRASIANFQITLRRLHHAGVIEVVQCETDKRSRLYDLTLVARTQMRQLFDTDLTSRNVLNTIVDEWNSESTEGDARYFKN